MARGAFHHALIIPTAFLTARPKEPEYGAKKIRREALYDSEDLARHLANYVMNQIPTLSIAYISSNDIIAPDIWSDPFRVYACLFAKASRILFLVTHQDAEGFANFLIQRLQPLIERAKALDYDWKSNFLVVAMGEFQLPESTPCEVIRFREIGWFRDSMALFILGKKIQEFCTPAQNHQSESIAKTEKLRFLTNIEETETFKASINVKNVLEEDLAESKENDLDNMSIYVHESAPEPDNNPNYAMSQNFSFRIDIERDRLLDIHELSTLSTSSAGLDGIMQPYSAVAHHFSSRSELGFAGFSGSSSDMDIGSPVLDETRSASESVGEMHWSPPDSVSFVQEAEVKELLSSNDDERTIIANNANVPSAISPPKVTEKLSVDHTRTLETPIPAKRKRGGSDQHVDQRNDTSPTYTAMSFQPRESDVLHQNGASTDLTEEISPEVRLEPIQERSVEEDSTVHLNQSTSKIQSRMEAEYSNESETKSPILERSSEQTTKESPIYQQNYLEVESPHLKERDELSGYALAEPVQSSSRLPNLPPSISGVTDELSRSVEPKSAPESFNIADKTSGYNTITSAGGRVSPSLQFSEQKSFLSSREEMTIADEPESIHSSPRSNSPGVSKREFETKQQSQSLTDDVTESKNDNNESPLISETGTPPRESQPEKAGTPKRRESQSSSSVQADAMTQSKADTFTVVTNLDDEYPSDTDTEQFKHEFTTPSNEDLRRKSGSRTFNAPLGTINETINTGMEAGIADKILTSEAILSASSEQESKDNATSKWLTSPTANDSASTLVAPANSPINPAKIEPLEIGGKNFPSKQERTVQVKSEPLPNANNHTPSLPKRVLSSENFEHFDLEKNIDSARETSENDTGPENALSAKQGIQSNEARGHDDAAAIPSKPESLPDEELMESSPNVNAEHSPTERTTDDLLAEERPHTDLSTTKPKNVKNFDLEVANTACGKSEKMLQDNDAKKAVDSVSELGDQQSFSEREKMGAVGEKPSDETGIKANELVSKSLDGDYEAAADDVSRVKGEDGSKTSSLESFVENELESEEILDGKKTASSGKEEIPLLEKLLDPNVIKTSDTIPLTSSVLLNDSISKSITPGNKFQSSRHPHSIKDQKSLTTSVDKPAKIQGKSIKSDSGVDDQDKADVEDMTKVKKDFPVEHKKSAAIKESNEMRSKRSNFGSGPETTDYVLDRDNIISKNESPGSDKYASRSESDEKNVDKESSKDNYFPEFPCHESSFQNEMNLGEEVSLAKMGEITPGKPAGQGVIESMKISPLISPFSSRGMTKDEASKISTSNQENMATPLSQPSNFPESKFDVTYDTKEKGSCLERKKSPVRDETESNSFKSDDSSSAQTTTDHEQSKSKITNADESKRRKNITETEKKATQHRKISENPTDIVKSERASSSLSQTFAGSKGSVLVPDTITSKSSSLYNDKVPKKVSFQSDSEKAKKMMNQDLSSLPNSKEFPSRNLIRNTKIAKNRPEVSTDTEESNLVHIRDFAPQPIVIERKSVIEQTTEITERKTWRGNTSSNPLRFGSPTFTDKSKSRLARQPIVKVNTNEGSSRIAKLEKGRENEPLKPKPPFLSDIANDSIEQEISELNGNRKQNLGQKTEIVKYSEMIREKSREYARIGRFPIPPSKSPSPFSDSDCDPEVTSSSMARPWHLWSSSQVLLSHVPPLIAPRTKSTLTTASVHADRDVQNRNNQGSVLTPMYYPATVTEAVKSGTVARRQKSCEINSRGEDRFSTISISDGEDRKLTEVVNAETGSTSSKSRVRHLSGNMPIRVFHETGEYQRNLSTQAPKHGKNQEDVELGPYYRQIREAARQIGGNRLTYWCDRSAGSPTPLEFSIGSDNISDVSTISEVSGISTNEGGSPNGTREMTMEALLSVHKALGKASKILANSDKLILKQVKQLKSEKR
ncbi:hypothetical protein Aperf_G00000030631 [Anoplocephala perfoliata]